MTEKMVALDCLARLQNDRIGLVDAWLLAWCEAHNKTSVYSFDADLRKRGLKLLPEE